MTQPVVPPAATAPDGSALDLLRGVSPVLEVPFHADEKVDFDGFGTMLERVLATGVSSVMFPGFAGEFHKLTESERETLTAIVVEVAGSRPGVAAIIAVQDHATTPAVARAVEAVNNGADIINLLPPHFLSPSRVAVAEHIAAILAAVGQTPVVLQYAPTETGTSLDLAALRQLAEEYPNLGAVKVEAMPPGALIADLAGGVPPIRGIEGYAGVQLPDAWRRGAVATQPGCSFTEIYVDIWRRLESGDVDGGLAVHKRLLPYISFWMLHTERIIAAEKTISVRRGWFASDTCRAPRYRQDKEDLAIVDRFMDDFADYF